MLISWLLSLTLENDKKYIELNCKLTLVTSGSSSFFPYCVNFTI